MIPKLRFPEFKDEWQEKRLGDMATILKGAGISKDDTVKEGDREAIRYGELYTSYSEVINFIKSRIFASEKDILSGDNDVIIPSSGEEALDIATVSFVGKRGVALGGDLNIIRSKENGMFLSYYLNHRKRTEIARLAQGVSIVHLYPNELRNLKLVLPIKKEQEKIADFLRGGDERMTSLEKKVDAMREYKKGVMSAIFFGKLRFKDGNGNPYPDWEEKRLGELLKERKEYARKSGKYEHISLTKDGVVPKSDRYERDFLVGSDDKKYRITRVNDICYNPANLKFGVIARNKYKNGIFSPIYVTYEVKGADAVFMEYYLTRWDFINYARRYEEGTVYERMAVGPEDFARLMIKLPCLAEQRKIADFLSAIDHKIELEQTRLDRTKDFKKGLLQRMFV